MIYKIEYTEKAAPLFSGWQETLIWSCLQNVMGEIYADSQDEPCSAMALIGDFCFLAGRPNKELAMYRPESCKKEFLIVVPQTEEWEPVIEECYREKARKTVRYAIKKNRLFLIQKNCSRQCRICCRNIH